MALEVKDESCRECQIDLVVARLHSSFGCLAPAVSDVQLKERPPAQPAAGGRKSTARGGCILNFTPAAAYRTCWTICKWSQPRWARRWLRSQARGRCLRGAQCHRCPSQHARCMLALLLPLCTCWLVHSTPERNPLYAELADCSGCALTFFAHSMIRHNKTA